MVFDENIVCFEHMRHMKHMKHKSRFFLKDDRLFLIENFINRRFSEILNSL